MTSAILFFVNACKRPLFSHGTHLPNRSVFYLVASKKEIERKSKYKEEKKKKEGKRKEKNPQNRNRTRKPAKSRIKMLKVQLSGRLRSAPQ